MKRTLIFVYNADSGLFNTVSDIAHKILSPDTYACQLCALTHGYFSVRDEWVSFLKGLNADCQFLHRDEASKQYAIDKTRLPAIFLEQEGQLMDFLDKQAIEACPQLEDLKALIQRKLQDLDRPGEDN